jgi:hypothetical protein
MKNEPQELRELRQWLSRLPDAPVSSNFTARVMQVVELEAARRSRRWNFPAWNWCALLPRAAVAAVVLCLAGLAIQQHEISTRRVALIRSVALVPMPSVEALKNFDAIRRMSQPAHADTELLALLQ